MYHHSNRYLMQKAEEHLDAKEISHVVTILQYKQPTELLQGLAQGLVEQVAAVKKYLFPAMKRGTPDQLEQAAKTRVTCTVWAFAEVGHASPEFFDATAEVTQVPFDAITEAATFDRLLAEEAKSGLKNFHSLGIATVGHASTELFDTLAEVTRSRLKHIISRDLAYTAISLTCAAGDTPVAQYLAQALLPYYIMAMTALIDIGTRIIFRHLDRPGWFGLSAKSFSIRLQR